GHHPEERPRRYRQPPAAPRREARSERHGGTGEVGVRTGAPQRHARRRRRGVRDPVPPRAKTTEMTRQFLIIDADDTLWENNIYFERAFDRFLEFLNHSSLAPQEVRDVLDEIERTNARIHGYGTHSFGRNLRQCYEHLVERAVDESDLAMVLSFAEQIL